MTEQQKQSVRDLDKIASAYDAMLGYVEEKLDEHYQKLDQHPDLEDAYEVSTIAHVLNRIAERSGSEGLKTKAYDLLKKVHFVIGDLERKLYG